MERDKPTKGTRSPLGWVSFTRGTARRNLLILFNNWWGINKTRHVFKTSIMIKTWRCTFTVKVATSKSSLRGDLEIATYYECTLPSQLSIETFGTNYDLVFKFFRCAPTYNSCNNKAHDLSSCKMNIKEEVFHILYLL